MSPDIIGPTVWIISELYAPELTSTGYFLTMIAEQCAARLGGRVNVVCSQPTYSASGIKAPSSESSGGVNIFRTPSPSLPKDSLVGRVVNMLAFSAGICARLLRSVRGGDVVIAVTNPPLAPYLCSIIARLRGARFVLLVHDMFPETLAVTGLARRSSLSYRMLEAASHALVRSADQVIAIGRDMERLLRAKGAQTTCVLTNWSDCAEINPVTTPLAADGQASPFIVQYAGNIGRTHDVAILLDAAEQLGPTVRLDFIGTGARRRFIEDAAATRHLANIRVADYRPRHERSASLGACHAAVISFVGGMSGISVPSRMYNIMASGRPIIAVCDEDSELALVVRDHQIGWIVAPGDTAQLVAVLAHAARSPAECASMGQRARLAAVSRYSRDLVLEQYADEIATLVGAAG